MKKLITVSMAILFLAAGCESRDDQVAANRSLERDVTTTPAQTAERAEIMKTSEALVLASADGTVQEEVVILDVDPEPNDEVFEVEVPEIIMAALADSPLESSDCDQDVASAGKIDQRGVVSNEDGSVQEEVVFLESEDDQLCARQLPLDDSTLAMAIPATK